MDLERFRYLGRRVQCLLCGGRFRAFAPDLWDGARWHGAPVRCPKCQSLPRDRFLWLYLTGDLETLRNASVLHLAPEHVLSERVQPVAREYVSADIQSGRAEVQADLTALPFADERFDLILCSHVLEHVPDDGQAMREMFRVLRPGGIALIQAPVNYDQRETYEDPDESDASARLKRFSQADHVRVFGRDLSRRLEDAGFEVTVEDAADRGDETLRRYGLRPNAAPLRNDIYRCRRAA